MTERQASDRVKIAIYDPKTRFIRQVVECCHADAHLQAEGWPGHQHLDVTDHPNPHPNEHMLCEKLKTLVPRVAPMDEARAIKLRDLEYAYGVQIVDGFESAATGKTLRYPSKDQDQINMVQSLHVGGALMVCDPADGAENWRLLDHTSEQARQVLADFVAHRDKVRRCLEIRRNRVAAAATAADLEVIS